jgi:hypothetical protein
MQYSMPGSCPVCRGEMAVTSLKCRDCESELSGSFTTCPFCRLSKDQSEFVLTFLKARGSIKVVERELGISYPTVRARLSAVLKALDLVELDDEGEAVDRAAVLSRLEKGEISASEAAGLLKGKKK